MVKRSVTKVKKESKMKQKQRQQQNVTVNIGTLAKKPRARKPTKPPQAPQPAHAPIVTRGPTTYFQQPQPAPAQVQGSSINELYRLIQQQAQAPANQPAQQPITTSIVPPPQIGEILKAVNELERTRKARVAKFEKPELEKVFEAANEDVDFESSVYDGIDRLPFRPFSNLYKKIMQEKQTTLLGENRTDPSINLHPSERIAPETETPNLSLQPSSLLDPPQPRLTRADTDTTDDSTPRENQVFMDMFSNSPSLKPVQTSQTLVSGIATGVNDEWFSERSVAPPSTAERDTFEEGAFEPEFVDDTEPAAEFQPEPSFTDESKMHPTVVDVQPKEEGESKEGITEIQVGESPPTPPPAKKAIYRGSANLPAIVQPRGEDTPLVQLLAPAAEPSLVEAVATEVRAPDQYRTETLVKDKGLPEAEAREVPQGTPKEQLVAFAKSLGVKTSSGVSGRHLKTELIIQNIRTMMGPDFEIPTFLGKKTGPQRQAQNATEL